MESSQRTSGGFVRFFLESIACLLPAPSRTNKRLASPNNQFASYASQHHLGFSEVRKYGGPLMIWSSWSQHQEKKSIGSLHLVSGG